ncbi:MAG: DUF3108 domain-containing protein [Gemmatimonadales bacterium]
MTQFWQAWLFLLLGVTPLWAQSEMDVLPDSAANPPFPVGETLLYEAKFGLFKVGKGMMYVAGIDTVRGVPSLHVLFVLRGGPVFYKLDDRMDSWIGIPDFNSRRFVQDFHEGGSYRHTEWDIYPDSGYYRQDGIDSTMVTSDSPLDDYAFFYFARTLDLAVGETYEFNRYFRPDRNPVVLKVLEKDTLDLPAGTFPTIVVHPIIQGRGILAESREARMWISDDDRRLMVQLRVKFSSFAITLRLTDITEEPPANMLSVNAGGSKKN